MAIPHFSRSAPIKTHPSKGNMSEEKPTKETIITKDYLVTWKNQQPDADGYYRIKTEFRCDVKLLTPFLMTLPKSDHDFLCVTDENARLERESSIRYHEEQIQKLRNPVEPVYDDCPDPCAAPMVDECEPDYSPDRRTFRGYYQSVTLYNKDGRDNGNGFYDKEEIRRFSERTLMLNEIIDDCENVTVSTDNNGKTVISDKNGVIGAQG